MDNVVRGGNWYWNQINAWRVLEEVELPNMSRNLDEFVPSGHFMGVEWPEEFKALKASIKHKTNDPQVRGLCGREPGDYATCTYYENLRSFRENSSKGRIVVMKGLLVEAKQASVKGLKITGVDYVFSTVVFYHDIFDGRTIHKFDYFAGPPATIVDGINPFGDMGQNLAISGGTAL